MIISACLIVKDDSEVKKLHRAVWSILNFVDNVYITANGKDTKLVEEYCKTNPKLHYSYLAWDKDFSKQRTFNFNQAPKDSDFIFWMDSDDILVGGYKLREVAETAKENGKDIVFFTYWYGCRFNGESSIQSLAEIEMEHMRERLIRPGTHIWKGRLHETPVPVSGSKNNYTSYPYEEKERPMAIMHTASLAGAEKNMQRNKEILELQLEDERKTKVGADPRTLLYLMKIYASDNNKEEWEKTITMGEEYLKKSGWDEERATCCEQMGIAAGRLGDNLKAIKYYHDAIREWSAQPLIYLRLAQAYYNEKNFKSAKHWLTVASGMDIDNKGSNMTNFKAMKVMLAELLTKIAFNVDHDTTKAVESAKMLFKEAPTEENSKQVQYLSDLNDLNEACKNTHKIATYLHSIGDDEGVIKLLDALPEAITTQPFGLQLRKNAAPSRKWARNEICYFANFGGKHFEKWDSTSLDKGIGGSETAVINLAKQWTKLGLKVTVYGDPFKKGEQDGVNYLPYYYFNHRDYFNIFIQWRGWFLADRIKARKFYVDLHDVWNSIDITPEQLKSIDKIMVKTNYHKSLGTGIPSEKFMVVSNGI